MVVIHKQASATAARMLRLPLWASRNRFSSAA